MGIAIVVVDVVVVVVAVVVGGADSKESEMYLAKRSSWLGSRTIRRITGVQAARIVEALSSGSEFVRRRESGYAPSDDDICAV